ncbi:recombinase family protein [Streptomyces luteogriseus]|uniref:recombinase family protein n=1 Tax=Streptomyces luteogriseus TaxID=68233 RepID=UPI0037A90220
MGKALIYARSKNHMSLQGQITACRDWCHANGHDIVRVRQEQGSMTALELAHNELSGEVDFDLIVAESADRFDRDAARLLSLINQAESLGVRIFEVRLGELSALKLSDGLMTAFRDIGKQTSPMGQFTASTLPLIAKFERRKRQAELQTLAELGLKRVSADFTMEEYAKVDAILKAHDDDDVRSALRKLRDGVQNPENPAADPELKKFGMSRHDVQPERDDDGQ